VDDAKSTGCGRACKKELCSVSELAIIETKKDHCERRAKAESDKKLGSTTINNEEGSGLSKSMQEKVGRAVKSLLIQTRPLPLIEIKELAEGG